MARRHDCITDPMARRYWREYRREVKRGNPLGLSFTEYVAQKVIATGLQTVYTMASDAPWDVASCGHNHPWGESCGSYTST
jgi:hypothetical protein